jgi:hypothetical protein
VGICQAGNSSFPVLPNFLEDYQQKRLARKRKGMTDQGTSKQAIYNVHLFP